ncbi:MAG: GDP-mannose 4,6-dehydratase [Lachnospiraceae bacterium]
MNQKVFVTGGNGFLGLHIILQLLQKGYAVKTSVRKLKSKEQIISVLTKHGIDNFDHLEFVEADLLSDSNWVEALQGCKYVLSVASPVFMKTQYG